MRQVLSCDEWKNKLNTRLDDYGQITRVMAYTRNTITLSNGVMLSGNSMRMFKRRVLNTHDVWVKNMDSLLSGGITEQEIKSIQFAIGGRMCQKKHGEKIKQNLNTGTPWNKDLKGSYPYSYPLTTEAKNKISKANSGKNNGMYGKKMTDAAKQHLSRTMKKNILDGKFTPNSNNRNTHWESIYANKSYRSSWEAWYQYLNPNAEYESLRLLYEDSGSEKIYIVDFIDHVNKLVIEVKPIELANTRTFNLKWKALVSWAEKNEYTPLLVTKEWLKDNTVEINYGLFDENTAMKIRRLYEVS